MADPLHDPILIMPGQPLPAGGPEQVGNKAWNLMRMAEAGLPVPPAFVLSTAWCRTRPLDSSALAAALADGIRQLEAATGLGFGAARRPLLVSVRSGAAISMPGMLETVLDVGLNPESVVGLIRATGNPRLAWDCHRRLVQGFAEVVTGLDPAPFEAALAEAVAAAGVDTDRALDHRALRALTDRMLDLFAEGADRPFPTDPMQQLAEAAAAVFASWDAPKAVAYRRLNGLSDLGGTAVTVQTMVFGNAGGGSGAGVGFTRDPATGDRRLYFDFCFNGQGEDVVAGRRTLTDDDRLRRVLPVAHAELVAAQTRLEALFRDAQDFEFTIQDGRLFLLQTRRAQRTPLAALRIAVDMVQEGLIQPGEALERLAGLDLQALVRTRFAAPLPPALASGVIAAPGVAVGPIALDAVAAEAMAEAGTPPILVRPETATSDIAGMVRAAGILTAAGSRTAHAAVVARQLGKPCLVGCAALVIDPATRTCRIGERVLAEGEMLSLDGNAGAIYAGALQVVRDVPERELAVVAGWRAQAAEQVIGAS
ncbi:MAG: pyruvate, phosphate dikinase [Rhodospirillales bacterium]|nr:pyruvate, phosphate dikinase [Rhodospirillales bacterium]